MSGSRCSPAGARGFASPEALIGVALALSAVLAALAVTRGLQRLAAVAMAGAEQSVGASWALERIAREAERAGVGVCPGAEADCPDEAVELLDDGAVAMRGDLDGDDPQDAAFPEKLIAGRFPLVATGADEVVVYLLRSSTGRGDRTLSFDADLDSTNHVVAPDGTELARRDGVVETIDAGTAAPGGVTSSGTLYRVTFSNNARYAGGGRFRTSEPVLDDVVAFKVTGRDAAGRALAACGGADDAAGRACRASIRALTVELTVLDAAGRRRTARRDIALLSARPYL